MCLLLLSLQPTYLIEFVSLSLWFQSVVAKECILSINAIETVVIWMQLHGVAVVINTGLQRKNKSVPILLQQRNDRNVYVCTVAMFCTTLYKEIIQIGLFSHLLL